jgi:hypothetical protein
MRTPESCCSTIPLLTLRDRLPALRFPRRRNAALNSEAHHAFQVCSTRMLDSQNNGSARATYDDGDI